MTKTTTKKNKMRFDGKYNIFRYIPTSWDLGIYQKHNRQSFADLGYEEETKGLMNCMK